MRSPHLLRGALGSAAVSIPLLALGACMSTSPPAVVAAREPQKPRPETIMASYYGPGFHGRRTASGEVFDRHRLTAAHRTHPFGTRLKVVNPDNGREVIVTVNDRGPFSKTYSLDLSEGASFRIGRRSSGPVEVTLLDP